MAALPQYLWLVITGAFAAFGFGWATGANDVANAFGTSVGAKTLTLRQAVIIAAIFEFGGAMLLGRVVTSTIAGGIADPAVFARAPEIYAYGMVVALAVGFLWQGFASWGGFNVSATHSIIGGIMGFALVYGGGSAVQWATPDPASFPPYKGVVPIILSWFFSPILTGAASALIFVTLRTLVLRRKNSYGISFWVLPIAVLVTVFINVFFVFAKGAAKTLGNSWPTEKCAWVSACIAAGCALLTATIIVPLLRRRSDAHHARQLEAANKPAVANTKDVAFSMEDGCPSATAAATSKDIDIDPSASWFKRAMQKTAKAAMHGTSVDIHKVVEEDEMIGAMHERAERFDERTEHVFGYLQVFSAICVIFAHGAGEVGYMAGPLSAIYDIYQTGTLHTKLQVEVWCVVISALSLVIGLATYGYNVTRAMGTMMAKLTPSRGFACELSTALVILVASQLGLPTSSSQCITGGIVGVGILEGAARGVNWKFFAKTFASWVGTLFIVGLGVAAIFAQGVYSPSKIDGDAVIRYENTLSTMTNSMIKNFNTSLTAYQPAAAANSLPTLSASQWADMNSSLAQAAALNPNLTASGTVSASDLTSSFNAALGLYQNNSVFTLGQANVYPGAMICNNADPATLKEPVACEAPQLVPAPAS